MQRGSELRKNAKQEVIDILIELFNSSTTEDTNDIRVSAFLTLKEISEENQDSIAIRNWQLAEKQESYSKPKESSNHTNSDLLETINTLSETLKNTEDSNIDIFMVDKLGSMAIGTGNQNAIAALSKLLNSSDYYIRSQASHHLWRIYPNKSDAIYVLTNLLISNDDEIRLESARNLWEIDPGNEDVINTLTNLLDSNRLNICYEASCSLSKFDPGNEEAIYTLMSIVYINDNQNKSYIPQPYDEAGDELIKILPRDWYSVVVGYLKDCQHDAAFEVIWQCAQNMPYPEFYVAWHSEPSTITHPEVLEITATGNNSLTQSLNLANLPQLLKSAIADDPNLNQKVREICINASKFIKEHRDNPAAEIYAEMVIAGCPERPNGEPETMQSLKVYYKLLKTDKKVVLVFYDSTALEAEPIGFSNSFLDALSKFGEEICVVTNRPLKTLKQFSPSQPQLVENMLGWMRAIALENQ